MEIQERDESNFFLVSFRIHSHTHTLISVLPRGRRCPQPHPMAVGPLERRRYQRAVAPVTNLTLSNTSPLVPSPKTPSRSLADLWTRMIFTVQTLPPL